MNRALTACGVASFLAVCFFGGRRSFGATVEYDHADVIAVEETCKEGQFVGGCKACSDCTEWEYAAGGCTYFKDTFCTLCEPIMNCPQKNTRCSDKSNEICLECDPGFWDIDCKPCMVCEAGDFEIAKCTQKSNTVCQECNECREDEYTSTACTYFTDTICLECTSCPVGKFTDVVCQTVEVSKLIFPASVYTVRPDTVCTPCSEPFHDGVAGQPDFWVEEPCNIMKDTTLTDCFLCPCEDRKACEFMTDYCEPGTIHEKGIDTKCKDCTKRRSEKQWEIFRCGGTSDALFKPCALCMEGEWEMNSCTETSDTLCPVCSSTVVYGELSHCRKGMMRCTTQYDTTCEDCEARWYGGTCCYHQHFGSCGTMTTRERIAMRYGFEGETNEEFVDFCLEMCDEFPDCLAFEIIDGGTDLLESGPNSLIGRTTACYFKASFSQEETDEGEMVYKGLDPEYDCYSNVCRQNKAFAGAYTHGIPLFIPEAE